MLWREQEAEIDKDGAEGNYFRQNGLEGSREELAYRLKPESWEGVFHMMNEEESK